MKKLSMLLVALLSAAMMMGFVGCKQEDNTPTGPATVATWESTVQGMSMALTAFDDKSWNLLYRQGDMSVSYAKGTYTGDATKDGELKVKVTHEFDDASQSLKELQTPSEHTATISGKTLKVPASLFGAGTGTMDFTRK